MKKYFHLILLIGVSLALLGCKKDPWHLIGKPGEPEFKSNWHNVDNGRALRFTQEGDIVFIQGVVNGGGNGSLIFILPEDYRPSRFLEIASGALGEMSSTITISQNGSVNAWYGGNAKDIILSTVYLKR